MPSDRVRAQPPPPRTPPEPETDPEVVAAYLEDASGSPPGTASGLLRPADEAEAAAFLRSTRRDGVAVLPQAARSSLTGGAVPRGEVVLSTERMAELGAPRPFPGGALVSAGPGVRLRDLQRELARRGYYYPPVPTYQEAMLGGTVSTNAGGSATFKYGVTRQWVRGLRVALFNGDVLAVERGEVEARAGDRYRIDLSDGTSLRVPVPPYRLPEIKKISAGYHAASPMDLVDLFVGSEGTLGLITEVTVEVIARPEAEVTGLVFLSTLGEGLALASALRSAARRARDREDPRGPDIRAIEFVDGRSLGLLRAHGDASRLRVGIPPDAGVALLFEMEIPDPVDNDRAQGELARFLEGDGGEDTPIVRLFRILDAHGAIDSLEFAFPEDRERADALREFREAVPRRVNEILAARRADDPAIEKVGGDLIVPFERLEEMIAVYEEGFSRRGLEYALWGHLSDGNLHPNALPRDADEVARGHEALLEFADEAARRGGCPLSEHGVGRNRVKQEMLRRFLGAAALRAMRDVKRALDPDGRFAPGVLFPPGG